MTRKIQLLSLHSANKVDVTSSKAFIVALYSSQHLDASVR